jgi:hypothetical protein
MFQYIVAVSFNGGGEKTTDLPQVKEHIFNSVVIVIALQLDLH